MCLMRKNILVYSVLLVVFGLGIAVIMEFGARFY